jgi:hypothetical protein
MTTPMNFSRVCLPLSMRLLSRLPAHLTLGRKRGLVGLLGACAGNGAKSLRPICPRAMSTEWSQTWRLECASGAMRLKRQAWGERDVI